MDIRTQDRNKRIINEIANKTIIYIILIVLAFITIGPFVMMISASLQNMTYLVFPFDLIPEAFSLESYKLLFNQTLMGRWMLNSLIITTVTTILVLVISSLAGFAFARGNFPGRDLLFWVFMGTLMVPGTVTIVPLFILLSRLGLIDSYAGLILPHALSIFGIFLMRQHFMTIPRDYDDAVLIDGGSTWDIFYRVMLPLSKPTLATLATIDFLGTWNAFLYPLIMTTSSEMRPLTVGLATMVVQRGQAGLQMAGATFVFLPTFIFFLFMQRYVVQGLASTGVKG